MNAIEVEPLEGYYALKCRTPQPQQASDGDYSLLLH